MKMVSRKNHKFNVGNEQFNPGAIALRYSRIPLAGKFAFPHGNLA